jgi:hypothetical protein
MNGQNRSVKGRGVATLIGLLTVCTVSTRQPRIAGATPGCTQSAIQAIAPTDTSITSATPQSSPVSYCDVFGYVATDNPGPNKVGFELALPDSWNNRFIFIGNGGFGSFQTAEASPSILTQFGFASAITDTGHSSSAPNPAVDATFALNNPGAQDDWLYRSVHVATVASKAIMQGYYTQALVHSYFSGCSNGGRQAMVEAEQFPNDYDGISAYAPALGDWPAGFNWILERVTASAENFLPPDKLQLLDAAVLKSCDKADGVVDGLIQDPRACNFDPQSLQCKGSDSPSCLTAGQVATVKAVYQGPNKVYPSFSVSDPASDNGWSPWIMGLASPDALGTAEPWSSVGDAPLQFDFQDGFLKYFVYGDATYNSLSFSINDSTQLARLKAVITRGGGDGTNPDLSRFQQHGGKLTIFHGWSDPALAPLETVQYYKNVANKMGGMSATRQFARLFMAPGTQHCGGGPGPNSWNPIAPVFFWVENGTAPDQIPAVHYQNDDPSSGVVTRTMPLCVYPNQAKYIGGDVNQASSWTCPSDS